MSASFSEEIARFIPDYPLRDDPEFSYEIARRKEFYDLNLGPSEPVPDKPGIPLLSQELQARFFSPNTDYRSGLLFHGMGTGKTCASSLIVEHFKSTLVGDKPRKRALVLVPNEDLERSYRAEVAYRCTQEGLYEPQFKESELREAEAEGLTALEMTELTKERRLRSAVGKSYEIVTYNQFLFETSRAGGIVKTRPRLPRDPAKIREKYSNRVIIIDEAHNLRIQPTKTKKPSALQELLGIDPGSPVELYEELHRFLHNVENCRIILLTGTPIWDQVYEIASLMNLILPESEQLPTRTAFTREFFDDEGILREDKAELLRTRFRGRVSFLRAMMTTAERKEVGVKAPWLQHVTIYPSAMSEFQYYYAKEALEEVEVVKVSYRSKSGKTVIKNREVKGGAVRIKARDAASFVFPVFSRKGGKLKRTGGTYGSDAFKNNIQSISKGTSYRYKDDNVRKAIRKNLAEYSSKFAAIVDWAKRHPDELIFIYDEFVAAGGGGAVNLALVLQEHEFVWAKSHRHIAKADTRGRKRFAVITSDDATINKSNQIEKFIDSFNRPDNMHAERCQIIIGSRKIAEGITIKNVRQVHVTMPHWNIPAIDQALGRIFRVGSHDALPKTEKYVRIFRHAAVKEFDEDEDKKEYDTGEGFPGNIGFADNMTMDVSIYKMAEDKEYYNTQIYRLLKEIAWDCPLTYRRNVLPGDRDNTRDCDYDDCNYRCDNFPERYIDKSQRVWNYRIPEKNILRDTYNLYYAAEDLDEMVERVQRLFGVHFSLRIDMIGYLIDIDPDNRDENLLLLRALDYIINARLQIRNRYGFGCYLKEQGNIYFLDNTISVFSNYPEVTYISAPLVTERTSLEDLVEIQQLTEDRKLVKSFCKEPSAKAGLLSKMHFRTLIILLEKIQELRVQPESKLAPREKEAMEEIMKRIGRNLVPMPGGIVIHNMYASEYTGLGYNVTVQEIKPMGMIRVFHPDSGTWTFVETDEEEERYIERLKQLQKAQREMVWETNPYGVYGFRDRDGKFKIREKAAPGKRATKGSVCIESSWPTSRLYALLKKLDFLPETEEYEGASRSEMIRAIKAQPSLKIFTEGLDDRSKDDLRRILALNTLRKEEICGEVEEWFQEHELFFDYRV